MLIACIKIEKNIVKTTWYAHYVIDRENEIEMTRIDDALLRCKCKEWEGEAAQYRMTARLSKL